jgi:type I restriction enzyme S subunit
MPQPNELRWDYPPTTIDKLAVHVGSGVTPMGGSAVYRTEGVVFVRSQNVHFSGLKLDDVAFIDSATHASMARSEIRPYDVLLNITGASIGRCCVVPAGLGAANVNQHVCAIRLPLPSRHDATFLSAVLASHIGQAQINQLNAGSNREGLNYQQIRRFSIPWPDAPTRNAVVEIVDALNEAILKTEQLIAKLKHVRQGLLQDLLARGIDDHGELRNPARHPEQFKDSPLGRIPKDWMHQRLGALTLRITDGTHQAVRTVSQSSTTVPFLYVSCVRDGQVLWNAAAQVTRRTFTEISKGREPATGMILYTAVGSFGHAAVVSDAREFAFQRHIACIYPESRQIDSAFLGMWLNGPKIRAHGERIAIGNAQRTVTLGELARFPILRPPMVEQRKVAAIDSAAAAQIEAESQQLGKLRLLKRGLMEGLLTGRVPVTSLLNEAAA